MICASLKKWWFPTRWVNRMKIGMKSLMKHEIELLINKQQDHEFQKYFRKVGKAHSAK